ncbi:hypothetical protein NAP1_07805 [Erythrobacter sp. NAP1]|uniref:hypothetical protein n=1 Tax=Erythrobacter sp. NAP1 TaxID=237727 RepID=UPI0000686C8A|nr:hypothetical protein [Erythrobacter sp. NAP1]EAQ30667.1 hypothetical protein NAP1_07805 [Erythrobacter sp. NAP1]
MRAAAVQAYPFAVASTQAYVGDDDIYAYPLPTLERLERLPIAEEDRERGFGYQIFEQFETGSEGDPARKPVARILAFRGTDFDGFTDIFYGTLRRDQIDIAVSTFEAEMARFDDDLPWIVAGHSLGGALATEVSIRYPEVKAYMFNTSPFYRGEAMTNDVQRTVFNERGEVLRRFARFDDAPAADVYTLNCGPRNGQFTKHSIRLLSDCLVWIAAYSNSDALKIVRAQGIRKPMVECQRDNDDHPGTGWQEVEPCVHSGRKPKDEADN